MANPVVHFEVMGKDSAALRKFYGEVFDWKFDEVEGPMDYATVDTGDGGITGGIGSNPEAPSYQSFYVNVDDLDAALEKVEPAGGKKTVGPMEIPGGGKIAMFTDPEGHLIGLHSGPTPD